MAKKQRLEYVYTYKGRTARITTTTSRCMFQIYDADNGAWHGTVGTMGGGLVGAKRAWREQVNEGVHLPANYPYHQQVAGV